jgi:predicted metal-dependent hydrolase
MSELVHDLPIELTRKRVKYLRIRVCPPDGRVKISAPHYMPLATIESFVREKQGWIEKQQAKIRARKPKPAKTFEEGEIHYFWGQSYPLQIIESNAPPKVELTAGVIDLYLRPGSTKAKREALLDDWYRQRLKQRISEFIQKYEPQMGVTVSEFNVKKMKTRWGSCNPRARRIWLSLELAHKPEECLEYVVVHEMVHLLEASHNKRFWGFVEAFMPEWAASKEKLSRG